MSQTPFSERAKFIVDRTKALFTLDPRWHEEPLYEGDPDPRVGELLERLNSADPIARTDDGEMAVRLDPDTLRGWLVTQDDQTHEAGSVDVQDPPADEETPDGGHDSDEGRAAGDRPTAASEGPRQKLTPLHSAHVRRLKHNPELLERYQQTGSWDEASGEDEQPHGDEADTDQP